jgi:hypothetical protein
MKSIPLIDGDEVDAFAPARQRSNYRPGARRAIKTKVARRARKTVRRGLRQGRFE